MKPLDPFEMPLVGTSLVEASAGTGKTFTLTILYVRMLVEQDLSPADILVVTYTQSATAELRQRVRERIQETIAAAELEDIEDRAGNETFMRLRALGLRARDESAARGKPDPLRRALRSFDETAISTIHGFCQRTLQESAFESGLSFATELVEKSEIVERTLAHDLCRRLLASQDMGFQEWLLRGAGKRWQFEPEALYGDLLTKLGADDAMPLVPPSPVDDAAIDTASGVASVAKALRSWAAAWRERGKEAVAKVVSDGGLNRNKYRITSIEGRWVPDLDHLASRIEERGDDAWLSALALPDDFEKLTQDKLKAGAKKNADPVLDPLFDVFGETLDAVGALGERRERRALWLRHRFVEAAREAAHRRRTERHLLFFDDLLSEVRRAIAAPGGESLAQALRERFRFALIDEFQDTDPVQYEVFRKVWHDPERAGPGGLVLIGDPKQAIYSFRGADVFTYLEARGDAGDAAFDLAVNYRSDPHLIEGVNGIFASRSRAFQLEAIEFEGVSPRGEVSPTFDSGGTSSAGLRVLFAERERMADATGQAVAPDKKMPVRYGRTTMMDAVSGAVVALLEGGATLDGRPIEPSDIAVLCRRKVELQAARRSLEKHGIPCVDRGDSDVFETREAWELSCVLHAMLRSGDQARLRAALATGAHGMSASDLARLDDEAPELAEASERFAEYGRLWSQAGFARAFEAWRRGEGVTARLLAYHDGERRLTNWLHLAELLQKAVSERAPSRKGLIARLERAIASTDERDSFGPDASLLRLERDDEAVALVTLHGSKGLEYPIVILPSLWEDSSGRGPSENAARDGTGRKPPIRFHDDDSGRRTLDLAGHDAYGEHVAQSERESFSEQLRLLYVALTRAQHQCWVAWGAFDKAATTPLAWLIHGEEAEGMSDADSAKARAKWSDEEWLEAWEGLAARVGPESVSIESLDLSAHSRWQPGRALGLRLDYREPARRLPAPARTTSFSALTREGHRSEFSMRGGTAPEITGKDVDAEVELEVERSASPGVGASAVADGEGPEAEPDLAADMHLFPRGAEAGTLLHTLLEGVDFRAHRNAVGEAQVAAVEALRVQATQLLERNGLSTEFVEQALHVVAATASAPLREEPAPFRLGDVAEGQLRPEIEFTLATPGGPGEHGFTPESLGEILASATLGTPLERYAERAAGMGFRALNGFLRGFIDAVFHDGERYYVVDYKSNHLGDRQRDYRPEALLDPMIEHDYILQYLLYTVAMDRHLATRIVDYDYDTHFGGVYYLFLRGFAPEHASGSGVFFDRPERHVVEQVAHRLVGLAGEGPAR